MKEARLEVTGIWNPNKDYVIGVLGFQFLSWEPNPEVKNPDCLSKWAFRKTI